MSEMDMEEPEFKAKQLRFEYSTAYLIAELEKRRPCEKCEHTGGLVCIQCRWTGMAQLKRDDNFKADKENK